MKKITKNKYGRPEKKIQKAIMLALTKRGWFVKETHGNEFQAGFPDLYATHKMYGPRWIEVKNPTGWKFTTAQKRDYPLFEANGSPIWILMSEDDIDLLFKPSNLKEMMHKF